MSHPSSRSSGRTRRHSIPSGLQRQIGRISMWVLLGLGALGGVALYWYTTPQETPSWARRWLPGLPPYTGPLYRWNDDQGRTQVTDKPPKDRPYEMLSYRSDANVMPQNNSGNETSEGQEHFSHKRRHR